MNNIEELKDIIHNLQQGIATHRESVHVKETWLGETVWDGVVEVFDLRDHPLTDTVYAWSHEVEEREHHRRFVTVLHVPPVVSAQAAVRAAIMQDYKRSKF